MEPTSSEIQIDPATYAVAESLAREAGKSLSDYLADLIMVARTLSSSHRSPAGFDSLHDQSREILHGNQLMEAVPGIHDRTNADHWSRLAAGATPWLPSEAEASPALRLLFLFNDRVQNAALLLSAAFHEASVDDFDFKGRRSQSRQSNAVRNWYSKVVHDVVDCSRQVRNALVHEWRPTPRAERLAMDAFITLNDLTPVRSELMRLCRYDRPRAFSELARHVELAADQFLLSADLLAQVDGAVRPRTSSSEACFKEATGRLLQRAGGGLSLTEGAKLLGTSRQALHKRVKTGSALGLMDGAQLVLPKFQFVEAGERFRVLEGLAKVIRLFDDSMAGRWSALQFLLEPDANLATTPAEALRFGNVQLVVNAAAAYVDVDVDED